ncbi:hypothetical protein Fmac_016613 [Flemingia macrophylla]|uniref:Protein kinase domain-containing protein n=1 Tax=Flemingia macrophylla TaxID=520843 RepID=A0ABD1MHU5_9FABA
MSITSVALFLFLQLFSNLQAYNPEDRYTVSCGNTGKVSDGERTWTGDADSKLLSHQDGTVSATATTQSPSVNQFPFTTARLSRSQFNYSFPVTTGPKFVRLFFYPISYPSFPRTDASFTVLSNQFTLLYDFNASLNADAENIQTIFKEYIVYVHDGGKLNLSFTPSQPNSYAFINGVEVLSMPNNLYYTSENDVGFTLVEHHTLFSVESSSALETEYRIKVGGQEISPGNDTGLFRHWAGHDQDYLVTNNTQNNDLPADLSGKMNITVKPDYVAPNELYRTGRNMGTNNTLNQMSYLTWVFPVHSGFTYVIRLHFCELDPYITDIGNRVFKIYIASQQVEDHADVMKWSQNQKGLAVQRNYAVLIPNNNNKKKVDLSLQMHSSNNRRDSLYDDAFLNGLEIFKISDNLAQPNPDPLLTSQSNTPVQQRKSSGESETTIIAVAAEVVSGVVLISLVVFLVVFFGRKRTAKTKTKDNKSKSSATSKSEPLWFTTTNLSNPPYSSLPSNLCRNFSLVEIIAATNNFDEVLIIGVGGFGHVYKGYIDGGFTPVAVKRLKPDSHQGAHEFTNEIEMLSQLRHLHLVSLIGYCNDDNEMILIYDFIPRGTLREHLYDTDNPPLSWKQRLHICIGAARGLHYLHTGAKHTIIHRDVKTTNILLDEKWVAKVSDFGLSRVGPTSVDKSHVSTVVKGSFGYLDPDYYKRYRLTEKSDVYSFGVVLFEILCARPPLIRTEETQRMSLANWARHNYQCGTMAHIVDPTLKGTIAPECFNKYCEIGVSCLLEDAMQRPSMNDVVGMLEFALQLQESAEKIQHDKGEEISDDTFTSQFSATTTTSGEHSYSYNSFLSFNPFSEIMDPKPR